MYFSKNKRNGDGHPSVTPHVHLFVLSQEIIILAQQNKKIVEKQQYKKGEKVEETMADDEQLSVAVAVIWTFVAIAIIVIIALLYLYIAKKACFESRRRRGQEVEEVDVQHRSTVNNTSAIDLNNSIQYLPPVEARPAPCYLERPPCRIKLTARFPSDADKQFVIADPDRFRLLYRMSFSPDPYSRPVPITAPPAAAAPADVSSFSSISPRQQLGGRGAAAFVRYVGEIDLTQRGKYTIQAFAAIWRGERNAPNRIGELEGLSSPPPGSSVAKFDYYVGVDPASFAMSLDIADTIDIRGGEGLLEMQRIIARHFRPHPGTYVAPLDVEVSSALSERYVVTISPQFMLLTTGAQQQVFPLTVTGNHIVSLTARDPAQCRSIEMAAVFVLRPPPPNITPGSGTITELMPITVASPACLTDVNLKHLYSVDGGEASLLYNAPFTVPCGEGSPERACRVTARTIGRDGTMSDDATANIRVLSASVAVYDPNIPSPVCVVNALEPKLVLQHHEDEHSTQNIYFFYRVTFDNLHSQQQQHQYQNVGPFNLYDPTCPIPIDDAHVRIEAFAQRGTHAGAPQSARVHYSWADSLLDAAHGFRNTPGTRHNNSNNNNNSRSRSESRENANQHHHHPNHHSPDFVLPPVMTVVCSGATLFFEEPPNKRYVIRYALDGSQPDEGSAREFIPGSGEVDVSEVLRARGTRDDKGIQLVARYFLERTSPSEPTRFGKTFSRDFSVPFFGPAAAGNRSRKMM